MVNKPKYGIVNKLVKALGSEAKVLESRTTITLLKDVADKEFLSLVFQILEMPADTPNWHHNIATLIGTARAHRSYSEIFTIKEKTKS